MPLKSRHAIKLSSIEGKIMNDNTFSKEIQPNNQDQLRQYTLIAYGLYAASIFVGLTSIAAVIMNYMKRNEVQGTWLASHFEWQIKTFWFTLIGAVIGFILSFVLIGIPILFAVSIWFIYRIVKGLVVFMDNKPIGDGWF
jgi:uncharacterized membrane protein